VFPVRYGLDSYILFRRNKVFKCLNRSEKGNFTEGTKQLLAYGEGLCSIELMNYSWSWRAVVRPGVMLGRSTVTAD
jgi:hypothetical protein